MTKQNMCKCEHPPFNYEVASSISLGDNGSDSEAEINSCSSCNKEWIIYRIEWPHYTKSGRWWRALIQSNEQVPTNIEEAKLYIENQAWCYVGGSYYDKGTHKVNSPIKVV